MNRSEVYFNLHRNCLSIRETRPGARVSHLSAVILDGAKFTVQPAGREKVRRERKKTVHAFVRGLPVQTFTDPDAKTALSDLAELNGHRQITYNPYKYDSFVFADTGEPVYSANRVLVAGKKIYLLPPI